jgi:hypothetical protein
MSISNWQSARERSRYHFDKWRTDTDSVQHLGRLQESGKKKYTKPSKMLVHSTGATAEKAQADPHGDVTAEENDLIAAGADPKMTIYRGLKDFSQYPTLQRMTDLFALEPVKSKLHVQFTGESLNLHIDKLYDLDADPNNVIRIMVMLQDWEPGQFLMYGNQMFDRWRAGDIHTFDWQNLPHATANASLSPRPMLVVTGVKTEKTRQLLAKDINIKL